MTGLRLYNGTNTNINHNQHAHTNLLIYSDLDGDHRTLPSNWLQQVYCKCINHIHWTLVAMIGILASMLSPMGRHNASKKATQPVAANLNDSHPHFVRDSGLNRFTVIALDFTFRSEQFNSLETANTEYSTAIEGHALKIDEFAAQIEPLRSNADNQIVKLLKYFISG
eukprot:229850_1